jgi:hypothetical protein
MSPCGVGSVGCWAGEHAAGLLFRPGRACAYSGDRGSNDASLSMLAAFALLTGPAACGKYEVRTWTQDVLVHNCPLGGWGTLGQAPHPAAATFAPSTHPIRASILLHAHSWLAWHGWPQAAVWCCQHSELELVNGMPGLCQMAEASWLAVGCWTGPPLIAAGASLLLSGEWGLLHP